MEKLLKTKEDKEQFLTWIAWLMADVLPQTTGSLEDEIGFCCLGVGCALMVPEEQLKKKIDTNNYIKGGLPLYSDCNIPLWLRFINEHYSHLPAPRRHYDNTIDELNDVHKLTFPQIAEELLFAYEEELLNL